MQKIFSTRLEETVIHEMENATRRFGITKKRFLEDAIHRHATELNEKSEVDVWSKSFGAWKRRGKTAETIKGPRHAFRKSLVRYHH
jgi:hypothetical protein